MIAGKTKATVFDVQLFELPRLTQVEHQILFLEGFLPHDAVRVEVCVDFLGPSGLFVQLNPVDTLFVGVERDHVEELALGD